MEESANLKLCSIMLLCSSSACLVDPGTVLPSLSGNPQLRFTNKRRRAVSKSLEPGMPGRPSWLELELLRVGKKNNLFIKNTHAAEKWEAENKNVNS